MMMLTTISSGVEMVALVALSLLAALLLTEGALSGYKDTPTQYHIQTDEGKERFFRFQTYNGQYRKERRLDDGTVIGSYGWVDPTGMLRMTDYIADSKGYRVLKNSMQFIGTNSIQEGHSSKKPHHHSKVEEDVPRKKLGFKVPLNGKQLPFKVVKKKIFYDPTLGASSVPAKSTLSPPQNHNLVASRPIIDSSSSNPPVLIVYGPLRSANVLGGRVVTRRRVSRPITATVQDGVGELSSSPEEDMETTGGDVFQKYATPIRRGRGKASAFIYRIPNQYHKEETEKDGRRSGSYGYVDPFGIRRVIHYGTNNASGFQAARDFKYVGQQY